MPLPPPVTVSRRSVLLGLTATAALAATGRPGVAGQVGGIGALGEPDANGVRLPEGFSSRIVARGGQEVQGTDHRWHEAADGGATFPTDGGGWIYVSNSELPIVGGVGALVFDADGEIVGAHSMLKGTTANCAGGTTPWGTWLSCEEFERGQVWECDPTGREQAIPRPALGRFTHEAAVVDPGSGAVYLTEDRRDGLLYRFVPDSPEDLSSGQLEAAVADDAGAVSWQPLSADTGSVPIRRQLPDATQFNRGEGAWFADGRLVFATTGDNRIWELRDDRLRLLYEGGSSTPLQAPDNVVITPDGNVIAAEDGGNLELVLVTDEGASPLLRLEGHDGSELTGPAFSPDGARLYFSSQRGGPDEGGMTFEVSGPFPRPATSATSSTVGAALPSTTTTHAVPGGSGSGDDDSTGALIAAGAGGLLVALAGLGWSVRRRSDRAPG